MIGVKNVKGFISALNAGYRSRFGRVVAVSDKNVLKICKELYLEGYLEGYKEEGGKVYARLRGGEAKNVRVRVKHKAGNIKSQKKREVGRGLGSTILNTSKGLKVVNRLSRGCMLVGGEEYGEVI